MARASAEDVRDAPPRVDVPRCWCTAPEMCEPADGRRALQKAISGSRLVVLPDAGRVYNIEAPNEFNDAVRSFLHDSPGAALATAWRRADVRP